MFKSCTSSRLLMFSSLFSSLRSKAEMWTSAGRKKRQLNLLFGWSEAGVLMQGDRHLSLYMWGCTLWCIQATLFDRPVQWGRWPTSQSKRTLHTQNIMYLGHMYVFWGHTCCFLISHISHDGSGWVLRLLTECTIIITASQHFKQLL